jgi:L-lactate dehydrogenase
VALAVGRITEAIMRDEHSILTISSILEGQYGLSDVAISVPTVIDRNGINRIIEVPINELEQQQLTHSANTLKGIISQLVI